MEHLGEQRFLHNLRSLNPFLKSKKRCHVPFFQKSRAKCARSAFLSIFGASAQLHGGIQFFLFHCKSIPRHLISKMGGREPVLKTFSPYFGLKFTIRHIPVIIGNHDISKL